MEEIKVENNTTKTTTEIETLAKQLDPAFQAYVLNTINTLLFATQVQKNKTN